jgi:hypothetical protein
MNFRRFLALDLAVAKRKREGCGNRCLLLPQSGRKAHYLGDPALASACQPTLQCIHMPLTHDPNEFLGEWVNPLHCRTALAQALDERLSTVLQIVGRRTNSPVACRAEIIRTTAACGPSWG